MSRSKQKAPKGGQPRRTRLFIGSSVEGLPAAHALQANLDEHIDVTVWNQFVFEPSHSAFETLDRHAGSFDFAAIVMTPDDLVVKRGVSGAAPRDNLIFELGFFSGRIGRARTFLVRRRHMAIELPTDLAGITCLEYGDGAGRTLISATGSCATHLRYAIAEAQDAGRLARPG